MSHQIAPSRGRAIYSATGESGPSRIHRSLVPPKSTNQQHLDRRTATSYTISLCHKTGGIKNLYNITRNFKCDIVHFCCCGATAAGHQASAVVLDRYLPLAGAQKQTGCTPLWHRRSMTQTDRQMKTRGLIHKISNDNLMTILR